MDNRLTRYRDWAPSAHDRQGLGLPDRQDWYVAPVVTTRDTEDLPHYASDWHAMLATLGAAGLTYEEHSWSHWACGHVDAVLVEPTPDAERVLSDLADQLDSYPALDEDDWSRREHEYCYDAWREYACRDWIRGLECSDLARDVLRDADPGDLYVLYGEHADESPFACDDGAHFPRSELPRATIAAAVRRVRRATRGAS